MMLFIYHHMGLGDHIICNGLIREIYERKFSQYSNIFLFCKIINYYSVTFMYKDLNKLSVIPIPNDKYVEKYITNIKEAHDLIKIGFEKRNLHHKYFDEDFYKIAGFDFNLRWEKFFVSRDHNSERKLFEELGIKKNDYVFIHEDKTRNYLIDKSFVKNKDLRIINPFFTDNIFDWCTVLENAKEIHCIDSSFKLLADSLKLKTKELFLHYSYINKDNNYISSSKYKWQII